MGQVLPLLRRPAAGAALGGRFRWEEFQLSFEQHGPTDGPPLLLTHGILLESSCNRDLALALAAEGYRVILLDLLGHGRSDKPGHAKWLRIDLFAEQIAACLDHLGIAKAIIGGVSLGAISSLHFAVARPERVEALVLEMPVMERATPAAALMLVPLMGAVRFGRPLLRGFSRVMRKLPEPRTNLWKTARNAVAQDPDDLAAILHGVLTGPVVPPRRERQRISAPTLIIAHGGDWLHNLEDARVLAREIPKARFVIARSMLELRLNPQRLLPKILRFLQASGAAAA
ncbi:MAG: alpha/beta fold hydrolase [Oceanococcaceae bacterium]